MKKYRLPGLIAWLLLFLVVSAQAAPMIMTRTALGFEAAMEVLTESIEAHGYKVAHVQKCDGGMAQFDYKTDFYRVVFLGKLQEVREISDRYPEMIPFLPLKIALFAEGQETIVVTMNPMALKDFFPQQPLQIQFQRWANDLHSIISDVRDAH